MKQGCWVKWFPHSASAAGTHGFRVFRVSGKGLMMGPIITKNTNYFEVPIVTLK